MLEAARQKTTFRRCDTPPTSLFSRSNSSLVPPPSPRRMLIGRVEIRAATNTAVVCSQTSPLEVRREAILRGISQYAGKVQALGNKSGNGCESEYYRHFQHARERKTTASRRFQRGCCKVAHHPTARRFKAAICRIGTEGGRGRAAGGRGGVIKTVISGWLQLGTSLSERPTRLATWRH